MSFKPLHPECSNLFRFPKPFFSIGCMQSLLKFSFKQNEHRKSSYMVLVVLELEFLKLAAACWEKEETRSRDKQFIGRACEEKRGKEDGERRRRNPGTLRSALCRNMWMETNKELHQNLYSSAAAGRTTTSSFPYNNNNNNARRFSLLDCDVLSWENTSILTSGFCSERMDTFPNS